MSDAPWFPEGDSYEPSSKNTLQYQFDTYQSYDVIYVSEDPTLGKIGISNNPYVVKVISNMPSTKAGHPFTSIDDNIEAPPNGFSADTSRHELLFVTDNGFAPFYNAEFLSNKIALNMRQIEKGGQALKFTIGTNNSTYFMYSVGSSFIEANIFRDTQGVSGSLENVQTPEDYPFFQRRAVISPIFNNPRLILFDRYPFGNEDYIDKIYDLLYAYRLNSDRNWLGKDVDDDFDVYDLVNWYLAQEERLEFDVDTEQLQDEVFISFYYEDGGIFNYRTEKVGKKIIFDGLERFTVAMYSVTVNGKPNDVAYIESLLSGNYLLFSEIENSPIQDGDVELLLNINLTTPSSQRKTVTLNDYFDHVKDGVFRYRANNDVTGELFASDNLGGDFYRIAQDVIDKEINYTVNYTVTDAIYRKNTDFVETSFNYEWEGLQTTVNSNDKDEKVVPIFLWKSAKYFLKIWEETLTSLDSEIRYAKYTMFNDEPESDYFDRVFNYTWKLEPNEKELVNTKMADSLRIKEIHQALEAQRYATYESTTLGDIRPRTANLGYYVERMARLLGINVLADGSAYTPKLISKVEIPEDGGIRDAEVPAPYLNNQWGFGKEDINLTIRADSEPFDFSPLEDTDAPTTDIGFEAMTYPIVTNKFVTNEETGQVSKINAGGVALVHNIPQLLDVMMQDVDKGLGLQEAGAFSIRSPNDVDTPEDEPPQPPQLCFYEGLHSLVAENAVMNSEISRRASKAEVVSMINQALLQELMAIMGLPIEAKSFKAKAGVNSDGEMVESNIYHPAFANNAPRLYELWTLLMQNIAPLLGNNYRLDEETEETVKNLSPEELEEFIEQFKNSLNE